MTHNSFVQIFPMPVFYEFLEEQFRENSIQRALQHCCVVADILLHFRKCLENLIKDDTSRLCWRCVCNKTLVTCAYFDLWHNNVETRQFDMNSHRCTHGASEEAASAWIQVFWSAPSEWKASEFHCRCGLQLSQFLFPGTLKCLTGERRTHAHQKQLFEGSIRNISLLQFLVSFTWLSAWVCKDWTRPWWADLMCTDVPSAPWLIAAPHIHLVAETTLGSKILMYFSLVKTNPLSSVSPSYNNHRGRNHHLDAP